MGWTVWMALAALTAPAGTPVGEQAIIASVLRSHVSYLASDDLAGRDTGAGGIAIAEKYIADSFRKHGLSPLPGQDDYFVEFTLYQDGYDPDGTSLVVTAGDRKLEGRAGTDFRPFGFSDPGALTAEVVFAGYGITASEHDYDDYEGLDVKDKIVLILRHEPNEKDPESPFDGAETTDHSLFSTKARNASDHGAAGMLLVTDPNNHESGDDLRLGGRLRLEQPDARESDDQDEPFLAAQISGEMAARFVNDGEQTLTRLQTALDSGIQPIELALPANSARLSVQPLKQAVPVKARNVVAYLEGSDPELKHELVIVGGHHDHIGGFTGKGDTVFNGADDNASGTSGVLELAHAFASLPRRPARSLVFATFSAEEKGLLGSRALVAGDAFSIEDSVFMLNLDMIGRNSSERLKVYGDGYARDLRGRVEQANREIALPLDFAGTGYAGNSDHDPFYRADVPFLFFFTGEHEDYHQLGDHPEKLDYGRMQSILRVAFRLLENIAGAETTPGFIHHIRWLGMQVEVLEGDGAPAAVITGVDDESRAAEAGFRSGDRLTGFDDEPLSDPARVGRAFAAIDPGTKTAMMLRRGDEQLTLTVHRARTGYMGVMTGGVDEDLRKSLGLAAGEGILLRQVVGDGPSDKAGLEAGDILIRIAGRVVGRENLRTLLSQIGAGEEVDITVVRDGERTDLVLALGERP